MNDIALKNGINELVKYIETQYHLHIYEHIIENGNIILHCDNNKNIVLDFLSYNDSISVFPTRLTNKKDQEDRRDLILEIRNQLS
ncbi:TPA: hypothetical protein I8Z33_000391 [Legionella pneumophila]|nr:hypothetical protein [Legionella pneumophila]HAT1860133.1 hypothetical protein [Legionella pneumophila]